MENRLKGVKVYVGHQDETQRSRLVSILEKLDMEVVGETSSAAEMEKACLAKRPDLIVSGLFPSENPGVDALVSIGEVEPIPGLIIAKKEDMEAVEKALEDHVMAYLIDPVDEHDLKPTIYLVIKRFEQFQELREENENLKEVIATRKKVERAKGVLMALYDLTEEDAYLKMRKVATDRRIKLGEVADLVIKNAQKSA
ncbi:response regulator [Oceaniferula spumae]|uniref:Response regulator n=1 Tax=Oceaniferula spumae TaxID=2979115 RepID=A0AAT9FP64_9BACT